MWLLSCPVKQSPPNQHRTASSYCNEERERGGGEGGEGKNGGIHKDRAREEVRESVSENNVCCTGCLVKHNTKQNMTQHTAHPYW